MCSENIFSDTLYLVIETPEQRALRIASENMARLNQQQHLTRMLRAQLEGLTELSILLDNEDINEQYLRELRLDLFKESQNLFKKNQSMNNWMFGSVFTGSIMTLVFGAIWLTDYSERNSYGHDQMMNGGLSGCLALGGVGLVASGVVLRIRLSNGEFNLQKIETQLRVLNNALNIR